MTEADMLEVLTNLFRDVLGNDDIKLTPRTTANDIEDWDSFNHLVLMVAVEKHFGIKLRTDEVESLQDIGDLMQVIATRVPAQPQ